MIRFELSTSKRQSLIDITAQVRQIIQKGGLKNGCCVVYCPHTTAGITINENADPDVQFDILQALDRAIPLQAGYRHAEGNSAAHVKSSLMGNSCQLIVEAGQLLLGTWQSVFFCEFDGPRKRNVWVQLQPFSNQER